MDLSQNQTLQRLYSGLSSPHRSHPRSPLSRTATEPSSPLRSGCPTPQYPLIPKRGIGTDSDLDFPTPLMTPTNFSESPLNLPMVNKKLESLSRNRSGTLPILEHLLSEEGSRPLSLGKRGRGLLLFKD